MKYLPLLSLCVIVSATKGATVALTLTGRVSSTTAGDFFTPTPVHVGDPWTLRLLYTVPNPAMPGGIGVAIYGGDGPLDFQVNGLFWSGQGFRVTFTDDYPIGDEVTFASTAVAIPPIFPGGRPGTFLATFSGGTNMVLAAGSLPDSFSQWNLPVAAFDLQIYTQVGATGFDYWEIRANSWETISIQLIPEPSTTVLAGLVAIAALGRRRRVQA